MHNLRKSSQKGFGPLRGENGDATHSVNYSDAMAQYFADVQWAVQPASCLPGRNSLGPRSLVSFDDTRKSCGVRGRREWTVYLQRFSHASAPRAIKHVCGHCACAIMCGSVELLLTHGTQHRLSLFAKMATLVGTKILGRLL